MSKAANIATQQRFGAAVNGNNLSDLKELIAPDVVDHDPAPYQGKGAEGFIAFFQTFIAAFPALAIDVEHMVADEENDSVAYTVTGTHRGEFLGIPATGRRITARGVQIARFDSQARMIERWGSSDQLGILQQLGAV